MSKNDFTLEAQPREGVGKGASRRLRREAGEIPAIVYGAGKEPTPITLKHKDLAHAIENEAFFSHIITLKIGGQEESVVIKDLQRHPAKPFLVHADFLRVSADHAIHVRVPLHFLNEEKCVGVKQGGGVINHLLNELEVICLPKDLPEYIEVDVLKLDVGDSLHISDLQLPQGVESAELHHGNDIAVVSVMSVRKETVESGEEEAGGEEAKGGEEGGEED